MLNKKFMGKSMAIAILGVMISTPILSNISALEHTYNEVEIEQSNNEYNETIIMKYGNFLTEDDYSEVYSVYEQKLSEGIELTDDEILNLLIEKINEKANQPSLYAYNIFGRSVTKEELKLVAKYPTDAVKIFNNSKTASSSAQSLYKSNTLYLGNGDAFRHAYWNALNVKSVGVTRAKQFADAHESETPTGNDKTMDLRNNLIGRNIGKTYINSSNTTIRNKIIQSVNSGRLYRLYNGSIKGKLIATDSSGRK